MPLKKKQDRQIWKRDSTGIEGSNNLTDQLISLYTSLCSTQMSQQTRLLKSASGQVLMSEFLKIKITIYSAIVPTATTYSVIRLEASSRQIIC
jgi:hypothetical protein